MEHNEQSNTSTLYERIGGHETFAELVHHFYDNVRQMPILLSLYLEDDLPAAERRLLLFLEQYWGGPSTYSAERGHPRLKLRHVPFAIGPQEAQAWLTAMNAAMEKIDHKLDQNDKAALENYFTMAADALINMP